MPVTSKGNQYISVAICAFSKYIEAKGNSCIIFKTFTSLYTFLVFLDTLSLSPLVIKHEIQICSEYYPAQTFLRGKEISHEVTTRIVSESKIFW